MSSNIANTGFLHTDAQNLTQLLLCASLEILESSTYLIRYVLQSLASLEGCAGGWGFLKQGEGVMSADSS